MRRALALAVALTPCLAAADPTAEVQRAVNERDRQSAELARPELREFHARRDQQHSPSRSGDRAREARDRDALLLGEPQPVAPAPDYRPLPLPGGPRHDVDPIPAQGLGR